MEEAVGEGREGAQEGVLVVLAEGCSCTIPCIGWRVYDDNSHPIA